MSDSRNTPVVMHVREPEPAWLAAFQGKLGNYELEPESDEEESRFKEDLIALKEDHKKKGENIADIVKALEQLDKDKAERALLKAAKKLKENALKSTPRVTEAEKKQLEKEISELDYKIQKVSAQSHEKKKLYTEMRMDKLFSKDNVEGREVLHASAHDNMFNARNAFIEFLKNNKEILPQKQVLDEPMKMISMEDLLTPEGLRLYEAACIEEGQSIAFRDAVFISSTRTYGGEKWPKRLIGWMGGPSSIGKSHATDEAMKLEIIPVQPGEQPSENHVVCIDGGVERNVSQMRQLVVQLGLAKGCNISDIEKHTKGIKTKKVVKEAVLKTKLNILNVTTFSSERLSKIQKEMREYDNDSTITQKFYQVRGPSDDLELLPLNELGANKLIANKIYLREGTVNGKPHLMYRFLDREGNEITGSVVNNFDIKGDLKKENLRANKFKIIEKIKEKERTALSVTSGYNRLKRTVNIMGDRRAFRTTPPDFVPTDKIDLIRANNRNIGIEGKAYDPGPFDFGVHESNSAREWFIKNIVKKNNNNEAAIKERYIEITNDLVYVKKDTNGLWVEASREDRFDDPALIRTNLRVFSALKEYQLVSKNLYPSDFETSVWIPKNDWQKYKINLNFEPKEADKDSYIKVSLASYIVAKDNVNVYSLDISFEKHWDEKLKNNFDTLNFKKTIIDPGGNPGRSLDSRVDSAETAGFVAAAIKSQIGKKTTSSRAPAPSVSKANSSIMPSPHSSQIRPEANSQPVLEIYQPTKTSEINETLEILKAKVEEGNSDLPVKITKEKQDKNNVLQSINFESNNQNESKHVKFEAEISKKDTSRVVYKIQPGSAGKNSSNTLEMKATYALLVKVAFETHFANPKTRNRQFIISVLPNLGNAREEAFVSAIIQEAKNRQLNQAQIKLMVPDGKHFKEKPITELHEPDARSTHRPSNI